MISIVFVVDVITGADVAISIFYLMPIGMLAWHRGWPAARAAVLVCTIAWFIAEVVVGRNYSFQFIRYWNALVRAGFFFIVAYTASQLRSAMHEAQRLARTDSLTGAANSRSFLEFAGIEVARQQRYKHPLSIAYLDCDDFKEVNDRYGHAAGDDLLMHIARTVQQALREVDIVARLGGDEFAILLPETGADAALKVCDKVRAALHVAATEIGVTFSIGVATFLTPPADVNQLIDAADETMYEAKKAGKNATRHRIIGGQVA